MSNENKPQIQSAKQDEIKISIDEVYKELVASDPYISARADSIINRLSANKWKERALAAEKALQPAPGDKKP